MTAQHTFFLNNPPTIRYSSHSPSLHFTEKTPILLSLLPLSHFALSFFESLVLGHRLQKRKEEVWVSMENLESNGEPTAAATSTARTETADADNGVNAEIPASESLTVVLSGGKKVSGGKEEFQEEKDKVNNAPNEKPDVASRGEKKVLNVTEEEKLEDVSNKNANENRPTMNIATSGDADDGVLVSKGEKVNEEEKIESTVKGREGKALAAGGNINNTPKKANRRKRKKKNTTLRIKKNTALKDSGDAVASISRGEETVSGTEKTGEDDEMKAKVGNTLNKSNKRKKLKKLTQGGTGSTGSVVSGGEEKVVLEKEVVNTPKEPNKLKRKKSISAESTDVNAILSGGDGKMEAEDGGKVESNPKKAKRRGRRGTKGKKENTTLRDAANAVAKDADKPETSTAAGKASEGAESMGMIFMCNSKTKGDCYHYKVLGLPASKKEKVLKIYKGMRLFLFDIDMKLLYGIYKAAGPGGYNIEHKAFNSAFPSQVRFSILDDCAPLPVEKFKAAIKDNFYGKNKFNCELTAEQVKNLCKLFRVTSKSSKPKQDGSVNRRDVPNSVDRGRKRRRDDDRVKRFELDGDRKRRRDDDRVKRFELDGGRKRRRGDDRVKRFELDGDRKRRRDHDRVKRSELDGDRLPARRDDVYKRTAYAPQPLPPTLPRASYEREAYASTLPSHLTPLLNVYGQPIQTGIYRSNPQHEHHHNLLTYSSLRPQREIKYEDSNILYREPLAYRDPLYPAGVPPGYYRPPY
ncbi:Dev_Cell_Death domain-containing protein [Cinnamomum micranthum f. kanehirae]|uniref:Dev_Cell_Death domain-containing protein n=1 Tax=Cinnamomum micranthum f. kanehirae TaxID=337451 RepID=A0A3S4NTX2_9MAGN|nr:Dev_Cell_Death domain-containing protein [Cinnamomum micranthum f. kanehirae]